MHNDVLRWIEIFLINRKMKVSVHGNDSKWCEVDSGTYCDDLYWDQSFSCLYVNNIPDTLDCHLKMFAHDTKIWNSVKTTTDNMLLQEDLNLNELSEWSRNRLLKFHVGKW